MAHISTLGIHTPSALSYCFTEKLLPDPPPPDSFTWTAGLPNEELLVAGNAVIWSQGGIIRRVFRYDVEKEQIVQAVFAWFPSDDPLDATGGAQNISGDEDSESGGYVTGNSEGNKRKPDWADDLKAKKRVSTWSTKTRSYAQQLGSFPKPHSGNEGAAGMKGAGARSGDGDDSDDEGTTNRARALVVFLKTQAYIYFLSGTMYVIHLPFEIQHAMPAPRGLILQRKHIPPPPPPLFPTGNSFTVRPVIATKDQPSLFTLTDPLSEPGLVMTTSNMPCTESLLFISPWSELDMEHQDASFGKPYHKHPEVIFAVTHNAERAQITVWQVRYVLQDKPVNTQRRTPSASGTHSRRRSSFGPGTGATTPVTIGGTSSVASTATLAAKPGRDSLGPSDISSLNVLGEDFESVGGRRSSRRVSSMMARADLSGNHDAGQRFSDVSGSLGASFGGPPAPQNTMILDDQPVDELLNELNMGSLGIGMDDLGSYDGEGLKQEVLMHKLESFPCRFSDRDHSIVDSSSRVFTLRDPPSVSAATLSGKEAPGKRVVLFIVNQDEGNLTQLNFNIQVHSAVPKGYSRRSSAKYGAGAVTMGYTTVLADSQRRNDILDAIKVQDGGVQMVLILTDDGKFSLYSPWGPSVDINLPPTLARWNPNIVGEDGSRRGSRKKEFARTLSTSPELYRRLEYSVPGGQLTAVDGDSVGHRISISMTPRESATRVCLETLRVVLGGSVGPAAGEGIYVAWMAVSKWMQISLDPGAALSSKGVLPADEWRAFVITLFLLAVPILHEPKPQSRRRGAFVRSTSMMAERAWERHAAHEGDWGSGPEYLRSSPWKWLAEEQEKKEAMRQSSPAKGKGSLSAATPDGRIMNKFITDCIAHARRFMKSPLGAPQKEFFSKPGVEDLRRTGLAVSLVALQILREEWKLDIAMEGACRRLCPVLRQLATWLGWTRWVDEYMLEDVEMFGWAYDETQATIIELPLDPFSPPDIFEWLMSSTRGSSTNPFMSLQDIIVSSSPLPPSNQSSHRPRNPFSPPPAPPAPTPQKHIFARLTPRTRIVSALYTAIATPGATDVDVVEKMVELKVSLATLQRLPEGVGVRLREAIARCQEQPPTTWGVEALDLVGRKDLKLLLEPPKGRREVGNRWNGAPTHEAMRDVHAICISTFDTDAIASYDPMAEHDRQSVSKLLFKDDRRLFEAAKLLQSGKPALAKCVPEPHWNDHETYETYRDVANRVAMRTLATPIGRGLFHFSARIPLLTERFPVQGFNLNCIIRPINATVAAEKGLYVEEKVSWAFFHSGVASGVSISREAKDIDTSWIVFNKPPDLTNRHGGFLLGLGLNGHLKNIAKWHAYNYLTPKHPMVSVGLLLGLSASFLGTMDGTITRLLSVHVTRLLPPGSADLNIAPLTQTAGIMGIGLLYASTEHRRMSEVMLSEIEYVEGLESCVPVDTLRDEGYRLAAGFALGLINLGVGSDSRGLHDMQVVERLLAIAVGPKKVTTVHILDKATAGATIALALIYMKTGDESVANKIDIPETAHLLDYVRPDIFLLRTVAKHLIMWDKTEGSFRWIQENLKAFHRDRYKMTSLKALYSEDLPFYNIMAALCFSIGLKYAGTSNESVRDILIHYLDQFIRLASLHVVNHDQVLTRTTVRNCQDLVTLSVASVMAGTGDVIVFRRLRRLHGRIERHVPYGSHLAAHLAIGVLFLGNGAFTFGTTNIAVASLLCAFYPLFPTTPLDNKCHLQAFRHFWVLAVENRCIIPRDVESMKPIRVPITVTLKDGMEVKRVAPCLLPDLKTISSVTTTSSEHWRVVLDFLNSEGHRLGFEKSQSIFVHRRSAHASQSTVFQAALQALEDIEKYKAPLEWIGSLGAFAGLDKAEKALIIREGESGGGECIDERLELEYALRNPVNRGRLKGVAAVAARREGEGSLWISDETAENLRAGVWVSGGG